MTQAANEEPSEHAADPYQQAGEEVLSGKVDAAIWARALVEGGGIEGAVKAAYVKLRVAQLEAKAEAAAKAEAKAKVWAEEQKGWRG